MRRIIASADEFLDLYNSTEKELEEFNVQNKGYLDYIRSPSHQSLILTAVRREDDKALGKFLRIGLSPHGAPSPIHIACGRCHLPCIQLLIKYGADVNAKSCYSLVPIDFLIDKAPDKGDHENLLDTVAFLIESGAELSLVCKDKLGMLRSTPKLLELLLQNGLDSSKLLRQLLPNKDDMVNAKCLKAINLMIDNGTDLSDQWYISWCCFNDHTELVEYFINKSPDRILLEHQNKSNRLNEDLNPMLSCMNPLCSVIYNAMEYGDVSLNSLKCLLSHNVPLQWMNDSHNHPFDQFAERKPFFMLPHDISILLLQCGYHWDLICDNVTIEDRLMLQEQGFDHLRSLQLLACFEIRIHYGIYLKYALNNISLPENLKSFLLLKHIL